MPLACPPTLRRAPRAAARHVRPLLMALALCAAPLAQAAPAWITVGERAYALLQQQAPAPRSQGSTQAALAGGASETVHLVQVDEEQLEALSQAVHESLRRCGGYRWHASRAEGLQALQALRTAPALPAVAAPSYAIDNADLVQPLLAQVQDSRILATIQTLSDFQNRYYTSNPGVQASDQLAALWTSLAAGRGNVSVRQVSHRGWPQKSVVLTLQGSSQAKQKVVLGAHLDSIVSGKVTDSTRAPGADDDASGVASLTEVIRVLLGSGYQPRRTIEFMAYAAEEVGLRGSQAIAQQYKRQRQQVVGVLQLDMTAFQGSAGDLYLFTDYTNAAQNTFLANLAAAYLPELTVGYDRCGYGCSDHASWTAAGFAASFPFEAAFADDNKAIHTANDTTATFGNQALHAAKFSRLALAYAVELGTDGPTLNGR